METIQRMQRVSDGTTRAIGLIGRCVRACARRPKRTLIALVIIAALAVWAYFTLGNKTPEEKAQEELAAAIAAVGQLMILPEGDEPVLATVTDAEALIKQQAFFSGAVNGDQLLLFPKNLKAVIYSPSRGKIINAGPIEQQPVGDGEARTQTQSTAPADILTVEVRNGTGKTGYAAQFAKQLAGNAGYAVVKVADAGKKDYQNTVVYVHTGDESNQSKVDALTTSLGVAVTESLPDGEKSTSADVLVILGGH